MNRWSRVMAGGFLTAASLLGILMLAGCASPQTFGRGGAFCDVERPIVLSKATISIMSESEIDQALAHNQHGKRECGWRKPSTAAGR